MNYLDSGLCFGGLNPIGENRFSFFFFFFSTFTSVELTAALVEGLKVPKPVLVVDVIPPKEEYEAELDVGC